VVRRALAVASSQRAVGKEVLIFFLVDPQCDAPRKKGQGIWAIAATEKFPAGWQEAGGGIATLSLSKRKFDEKLKQFIASLSLHRRGEEKESKTGDHAA
jgi:hypothetical protein